MLVHGRGYSFMLHEIPPQVQEHALESCHYTLYLSLMSETSKIVTLSIVAAGMLATALGFALVEPILAPVIPAILWTISAIVRAIRGNREAGQGGQLSQSGQADTNGEETTATELRDPPS